MEHNKIVQQKDHIILPKATLGRQVDGLIPVFPPIFIGPFLLLFPAFRHGIAGHFFATFARGGGGAADMFDKGAFKRIWVELARRQNGWHRHNEILLIKNIAMNNCPKIEIYSNNRVPFLNLSE